jgi:alpha-N-arabinofuranosidase
MNRQTKFLRAALFCAVLASASPSFAQTPQTYQNPVLRGMNPDPSIIRVGADYYLVTSSFEYFPGCPIYHSLDLVHWQRIGYALSRPTQYALDRDNAHPSLYAATLRYHHGTFYVITTDVRGGGNFYVTATNPAGPWSDPIFIEKGMFDPSLLFDDDGKVYYTRRGPDTAHGIIQAEIDIKTGHLLTPLKTIAAGFLTPWGEGPHLYKINGWYYLTLAEGGSRFLHMETIARSRSPWGPFSPSPSNPFIAQHLSWDYRERGTGHSDLVQSPDSRWWAVYLGTRHDNSGQFSLGRETFLAPVQWIDGWPHIEASSLQHLNVKADLPPQHPWPDESSRDDFSTPSLSHPWNLLGPPQHLDYSLSERPGYLRLHGQADGLAPSPNTAFIGCRQTERSVAFDTSLDFAPHASNEEAGIVIYMAPHYHYEIFKSIRGGHSTVQLRKSAGDITEETPPISIPDGPLQLRITSDAEAYHFYYATEPGKWNLIGSGTGRLIASEIANVWTGAYLGMYSTGNGTVSAAPADFDWADYRILAPESPDF